ncbi:MFS transporter [Rhodanobacter thiooxydans]|uniref:MFS transporter n=1 Tax=Rhodanobacter thiooxydans TaxID=416169 RepID=A0A154QK83_9GAMM|nr:MFS transporter [Rhodanobacter thiooxydans]EIL99093.1 major facilitator superfamily permease [Rhodanobacter thiooxydans LCS2]KZC24697.1 MFS transporter [Rhodanobacter thiooxydans]MCW0202743.1 MFS transporter [Rhodanobacter thiooxydans]
MSEATTLAIPEATGTAARPLDRRDARTLLLSALGGALEFYDFVVFVFFAIPLSHLFFPPDTTPWLAQLQVFGIFAVGYLARPLGGIVMAHYGDKLGRKRMFTLSVFLMAVPTLAIGLLPVYAQIGMLAPLLLLLLRVVQGIAVGGEVPGAWVFVAEHVPPKRIGLACASLTSGLTAGILIGSLAAAAINSRMTPAEVLEHGWRLPFLAGGVFGFVAVWLRRWLSETPVFEAMHARKELASGLPLRLVFERHLPGVLLSMLVTWMLTAAIVVLILMTPTLAQSVFHVAPARAFLGNSVASFALALGCLFYGWLADRIGHAHALLAGAIGLFACGYALYIDLQAGAAHFVALYALAGFAVGVVGVVPALMVAAFPPPVRFSGLSFSYNIAYALFGGLTPLLIGWLLKPFGVLAPAHYVAFTAMIGIAVAAWLLAARRRVLAPA